MISVAAFFKTFFEIKQNKTYSLSMDIKRVWNRS